MAFLTDCQNPEAKLELFSAVRFILRIFLAHYLICQN